MKYIFLLIFSNIAIFGFSINKSMLKIHATLVPKLFLLEHGYQKNIQDNTILITIVYETTDYKSASYLKHAIKSKYSQLNSYKLAIKLISYEDITNCNNRTNVLYLFPTDTKSIHKAVEIAKKCQALTFCYEMNDLSNDAMISINIGKKVEPILNLQAIKNSNISFQPVLLNISKIYIASEHK